VGKPGMTPADLRRLQSDAKRAVGKQLQNAVVEQAVARIAAARDGAVTTVPLEHVEFLQCQCGSTHLEPKALAQFARDKREPEGKIGLAQQQYFRCVGCHAYMQMQPSGAPAYYDFERVQALYDAGRAMGARAMRAAVEEVLLEMGAESYGGKGPDAIMSRIDAAWAKRAAPEAAAPPAEPEPTTEVKPC